MEIPSENSTPIDNDILTIPNPNIEYKCFSNITSKGFKYIHKLVLSTRKNPDAINILRKYLNSHPENINVKNTDGWTPLMLACCNSNTNSTEETVQLLLEHPNIYVNTKINIGWTSLIVACHYCTEESIKLLLEHPKIDVNATDNFGATALIHVFRYGITRWEKIVKLLLDHPNIDVNAKENSGWTALMYARRMSVICMKRNVLELLLNHSNIIINSNDIDDDKYDRMFINNIKNNN